MIKAKFELAKEVVLLTRNYLLANSIKDNLLDPKNTNFFHTYSDYQALAHSHNKINLLIVDLNNCPIDNTWHYKIKTLINLTSKNKYLKGEINISKPFRLISLLKIIQDISNSEDIFCVINKDFIYNEKLHTISTQEKSIKWVFGHNE